MNTQVHSVPVLILAGGLGTRLSEETALKPKPMVEIGDLPILVHLMRSYYAHGFNDFVICAGYRAWDIKQFFLNYELRHNHLLIDHRKELDQSARSFGKNHAQERWRVRVIDTGVDCLTGARVARAFDQMGDESQIENFAVTYGDGLCDVNLKAELQFHLKHGKTGTVLGVPPLARFGELAFGAQGQVTEFREKLQTGKDRINGGFFFFKRAFRDLLSTDSSCVLEKAPVSTLAQSGQLIMYPHDGFWHPMDTLRDRTYLQELWSSGNAPWATPL